MLLLARYPLEFEGSYRLEDQLLHTKRMLKKWSRYPGFLVHSHDDEQLDQA